MKKLLLIAIALMVGFGVSAQFRPAKISNSLKNQVLPAPVKIDNQMYVTQPGNAVANSKSVLDDVIGSSATYDMQSNAAMMSRLYRFSDGTIGGTWTTAYASGASDRGSGYNYYNGTTWGAAPSARIETVRTGWPNLNPWNGNGELVVSHNSTPSLVFNTRPVKGTGSWTQTLPLTCPSGITDLVWPRAITSGANNKNIHIITVGRGTLTGQTQSLLYYRSQDNGTTWDKMGVQLPGTDGTVYLEFGGDDYAWIEPHHDTIAFVVGGHWTDTFLMYSYDNGTTWTKKIIVPNYYGLSTGVATPSFICTDGTISGAMDKNGVFHVAFGRMRAATDGSAKSYYPGTDGIVYWNSTQAPIDTAVLTDINACFDAGILLGYVADNGTDSIIDFPYYGVSLSAFPQMMVDNYNNVYCLWSSVTVGNPSPDPYNYRHIWGRALYNGHTEWSEMKDLNSDITYMFMEYTYPACATSIVNDKILMLTQTSSQPGSNIKDTNVPVHEVNIEYREVPGMTFAGVGMEDKNLQASVSTIYPNPVKEVANLKLKLQKAANVVIEVSNVMGQNVLTMDKGMQSTGGHLYTFGTNGFASGIYFVTVKIGGESFTQKMIVK
jgi:hypothetical protein